MSSWCTLLSLALTVELVGGFQLQPGAFLASRAASHVSMRSPFHRHEDRPRPHGWRHPASRRAHVKPAMVSVGAPDLNERIARFYDDSSSLWEEVWGEHMHMGHYGTKGDEKKTDSQAQIDMIDRFLDWGLDGAAVPTKVLDAGCGVGGSSRHIARRYPGAAVIGVTLSPLQCDHGTQR